MMMMLHRLVFSASSATCSRAVDKKRVASLLAVQQLPRQQHDVSLLRHHFVTTTQQSPSSPPLQHRLLCCTIKLQQIKTSFTDNNNISNTKRWQSSSSSSSSAPKDTSVHFPPAGAAAAAIAGLLTVGAAVGAFKPLKRRLEDDTTAADNNKASDSPSTPPPPPPTRDPTEPGQVPATSTTKKEIDGLVYDDPNDDEPTHCSLCRMFRQGPCRPYFRPFELCLKQNEGKRKDGDSDECLKFMQRFHQECLINHQELYSLIELQQYQDEFLDREEQNHRKAGSGVWHPLKVKSNDEEKESDTQRMRRILLDDDVHEHMKDCWEWSQLIKTDWSLWREYVLEDKGWNEEQLQRMLETERKWLAEQTGQGHPIRPTWWSDRELLPAEGTYRIVDAMSKQSLSKSTATQEKPSSKQLPFRDTSGPLKSSSTSDKADASAKQGEDDDSNNSNSKAYWEHMTDEPEPFLVPVRFKVPLVHPTNPKHRFYLAYARDAESGRLMGLAWKPSDDSGEPKEMIKSSTTPKKAEESESQGGEEKEEDDEVIVATSISESSHAEQSTPNTFISSSSSINTSMSPTITGDDAPATRQLPQPLSPDDDETSGVDSRSRRRDDHVVLFVTLVPGRTASLQLFAHYFAEDGDEQAGDGGGGGESILMESLPFHLVDVVFPKEDDEQQAMNERNRYLALRNELLPLASKEK